MLCVIQCRGLEAILGMLLPQMVLHLLHLWQIQLNVAH